MRAFLPIIACAVISVVAANPAVADTLVVKYDQSQLLRLPRPVAEVIVGNPSIVDVAIQGGNLLVVTGKTFGVTNVIALDADRNIIQDQRVQVERERQNMVSLHRGANLFSFSCVPNCSAALSIGDQKDWFDMIVKQNKDKTAFSEGSVGKDAGQ